MDGGWGVERSGGEGGYKMVVTCVVLGSRQEGDGVPINGHRKPRVEGGRRGSRGWRVVGYQQVAP